MIASIRPLERPGILALLLGMETRADWVVGGCGAKWFDFCGVPFFWVGGKGFEMGSGGCSFNDLFKMIFTLISEIWFDFPFLLGEHFCLKAVWRNDKR